MGVQNRDYMRDDGRRSMFSAGRLTWWIIGINGVLWLIFATAFNQAHSPGAGRTVYSFIDTYLVCNPGDVFGSLRVWELFTGFWLHDPASVRHVFWNMLLLYFFGRQVESSLGRQGYLRLYMGGGLLSMLIFTLWALVMGAPQGAYGASGAVYAVMAWMALQNPRATVLLMFVFPVPIWLLVGLLMVGGEFVTLAQSGFTDGAAVGHLAGAAWGYLAWRFLPRFPTFSKSGPGAWMVNLKRKRQADREGTRTHDPVADRTRVDALLEKISEQGMSALSEEEKRFLQDASKRYR